MARYEYFLESVENLEDAIDEINKQKGKIISAFPLPNTEQFVIIFERSYDNRSLLDLFRKRDDDAA
jgi:hypothetical protein